MTARRRRDDATTTRRRDAETKLRAAPRRAIITVVVRAESPLWTEDHDDEIPNRGRRADKSICAFTTVVGRDKQGAPRMLNKTDKARLTLENDAARVVMRVTCVVSHLVAACRLYSNRRKFLCRPEKRAFAAQIRGSTAPWKSGVLQPRSSLR